MDNPLIKELASLGATPGYDLSKDPAIAIRAIQHKPSQVGTKAKEFLNDPATSPQDKQLIKELTDKIYSSSTTRYSPLIDYLKANDYENYIKLPALSNTETSSDSIRDTALQTLANNGRPTQGTSIVKNTIDNSVQIENKAEEQVR